ncbi:DUF1642 domain-containing protein [Paenilisteria newyorkensis]|uniref:DUF1642 domain-containing protein n=1 Tax=Listeria newyorkensis TaxID=1497681 RepID=UPI000669E643|nr:DUF1642 domain-containing protein [Listeria newyorkensis]KMT62546.1 hypothetical protein X559_1084 [Listeria newyorkensis]
MTQKFNVGDRVQFVYNNEHKVGTIISSTPNCANHCIETSKGNFLRCNIDLAPAPALVVVPQFVDVYIKNNRQLTIYWAIRQILHPDSDKNILADELVNWVAWHSDKFARAWLDGYTVEKEPLYYVKLPYVTWDEDSADLETNFAYLQHDITSDETRVVFSAKIAFSEDFKSELNEATIKSIDERYWAFAVPVEEDTE